MSRITIMTSAVKPAMKFSKWMSMLALAGVMAAASLPATAGGYRHGGHSHARVGVYIGAPVVFGSYWMGSRPYYPYAYYPSYYYSSPPVVVRERVVVQEPLVFYDERGNPVPAQGQVAQAPAQAPAQTQTPPSSSATPTWYFCADTQTYYPYAQTCASPWQRVIPHPPPQ
jgi:hypothetical protein